MFGAILAFSLLLGGGCSRTSPAARKEAYLESGKRYFQNGRYREAAIQFQNAIQIDGSIAEAHHQLAQCYVREQLWPDAYRELLRTIELDPKNMSAQLDLAEFLFRGRQFKAARENAALLFKENPDDVKALLLLATSDGELGDLKTAIQEAKQAVQIAGGGPTAHLTLGLLLEKAQQFKAGEQSLLKAVALDSRFLPARLGLGSFYERRRNFAAAEDQYRSAIELDRVNPVAWYALASLYVVEGNRDRAEQVLLEAKKSMPGDPNAYRLLGDFYLAGAESGKALSEFASLSEQHPDDLVVKRRYIQILIQDKQFDRALKANEEILWRNSHDPVALIAKGEVLNMQQKPGEAIPILERAVTGNPEIPEGHLLLGLSYFATGNLTRAEKELREAAELKPSMVDAQRNLASLALRKGDIRLLERSASAWVNYSPLEPKAYLLRGTARLKRGDIQEAQADLLNAIKLDSKNATAYARLGDLRLSEKRFAEAENLYEKALSCDPGEGEALQGLIGLFLAKKQAEKATARAEAQVAKVPGKSVFHFLLGEALLADHKTLEARTSLQRAVDLDPANPAALLLLAQVQEAVGQPDAAASTYERLIRLNAQDVRPYIGLGVLEERRGDWQKAEQLYQKALKIQADQASAANNLGYLLLEHGGDLNYALSLAQIARGGMPDSPNVADTLGWAYCKMGLYDSAISLLQEAVKKSPQNPTFHYHLGVVYRKVDKMALARTSFERALQLSPASQRAQEISQALEELSRAQ